MILKREVFNSYTGSNPVLTAKQIKIMENISTLFYLLCALFSTIALWGIAIELEKIRKKM